MTNMTSEQLVDFVEFIHSNYRSLGVPEKACGLNWDFIFTGYLLNAIKSEKQSISARIDEFSSYIGKTYSVIECDNLTFLGTKASLLTMGTEGGKKIERLSNTISTGIKDDVLASEMVAMVLRELEEIFVYLEFNDIPKFVQILEKSLEGGGEKLIASYLTQLANELRFQEEDAYNLTKRLIENMPYEIKTLKLNDPVSKWIAAFEDIGQLQEAIEGVKIEVIKSISLLSNYFLDPFSRQIFVLLSAISDKTSTERISAPIQNSTLDKLVLYSNLHFGHPSPQERQTLLQQLRNKHASTEPELRLQHYIFYVDFQNKNYDDSLTSLDKLISSSESQRLDFYKFAYTVINSTGTALNCKVNNDAPIMLLSHLLSTKFHSKYWDIDDTVDTFETRLQFYIEHILKQEREDFPELTAALEICVKGKAA